MHAGTYLGVFYERASTISFTKIRFSNATILHVYDFHAEETLRLKVDITEGIIEHIATIKSPANSDVRLVVAMCCAGGGCT